MAAAGCAALGARIARAALEAVPPGGRDRWQRTNHRGEPVSLLEGPAWVAGALAGLAASGAPGRLRTGAAVTVATAGAFGALDDLHESGRSKGLRGHLGALVAGELTTGGAKVLGIGAGGLAAASIITGDRRRPLRSLGRTVLGGALIAGSANLVNLFDLRPGRALKVTLLAAPAACAANPAGALAATATGVSAALLPEDLAERGMLGDTGANAAGALLGSALVSRLGVRGQAAVLAAVVGLTLTSEKVSFTRVIEATPVLRELDGLGRRR
ncbi:MAG: hypothetical protein GXX79_14265 [Actinomycetales bacterium]|nr:hypothetical protein [Actinomycetales bacterium]